MKLSNLFNKVNGAYARSLIRAIIVLFTAFGLDLTAEQVGAILLVTEAIFVGGVASPIGNSNEVPPGVGP
jgi:hypothetical protein